MSLIELNNLQNNEGARPKKTRVGRGIGSGVGKTSGRGVKGAKARSGVAINGFEGGQMPLYRRLPKFGFTKPNRKEFSVITTGGLQRAVEAGKLDAGSRLTEAQLVSAGLVKKRRDGLRLVVKGELTSKIDVQLSGISAGAREMLEKAGGSVALGQVAADEAAVAAKPAVKKTEAVASSDEGEQEKPAAKKPATTKAASDKPAAKKPAAKKAVAQKPAAEKKPAAKKPAAKKEADKE